MKTRPYKLYWTQTATTNAAATLRIAQDGVITAIAIALNGIAGASTAMVQQVELAKTSANNITVNDTPASVLAEASLAYAVSGGAASFFEIIPALNIPVKAGDLLYAHQIITGTAPASCANSIRVFVRQN